MPAHDSSQRTCGKDEYIEVDLFCGRLDTSRGDLQDRRRFDVNNLDVVAIANLVEIFFQGRILASNWIRLHLRCQKFALYRVADPFTDFLTPERVRLVVAGLVEKRINVIGNYVHGRVLQFECQVVKLHLRQKWKPPKSHNSSKTACLCSGVSLFIGR